MTPFHWSYFRTGFTAADHTWLPVSEEYKTVNALQQLRAPQSHLQIFKTLVRVRQEPSFKNGTLNIQAIGENIVIYSRLVGKAFCLKITLSNNLFLSCSQEAGSDIYVVVLNLGDSDQTINLTQYYSLGAQAEVITSSVQSQYINGETVQTASFVANGNVGTVLVGIN